MKKKTTANRIKLNLKAKNYNYRIKLFQDVLKINF